MDLSLGNIGKLQVENLNMMISFALTLASLSLAGYFMHKAGLLKKSATSALRQDYKFAKLIVNGEGNLTDKERKIGELHIHISENCEKELREKVNVMVTSGKAMDEYSIHNSNYAIEIIREKTLPELKKQLAGKMDFSWKEEESDMWDKAGCIGTKWELELKPSVVAK